MTVQKNARISPVTPRVVSLLVFPSVELLHVGGPLQVFSVANAILTERGMPLAYDTRVVASANAITSTAGLALVAKPLPRKGAGIDTLLVAGGSGVMSAIEDAQLVEWVMRRALKARRVASVCTGAFMLGAAGILNGRRAVTHWEFCDLLSRRFPLTTVDPDPLFIRDGSVWTSAGMTAGIDLALALVEEDLGHALALTVAQRLMVFLKRQGCQTQFNAALTLQASDTRFADLHQWIADNVAGDLSLSRLAERAGMSERTFSRHYRHKIGITPIHAVERLRVEAARKFLLDTHLPVKCIASRCGFGTEETMRRAFLRVQGVGPKEYRNHFS